MTKRKIQSSAVVLPSPHVEVPDFVREKVVPATISLAEAALILGIHKSTAWALYQRGTFPVPALKVGTRIRVLKVHIHQFLETGKPVTFTTATASPVAFKPERRRSNAG